MNFIGKIIEEHFADSENGSYNFQSTLNVERNQYKSVPRGKNDLQFLFEEPANRDRVACSVGHWICIYYCCQRNKVYVYDSFYRKSLTIKHRQCIHSLYPWINLQNDVIYEVLKNRQNDGTSCGVYASAYAISKVLGKNIPDLNLKISSLRNFFNDFESEDNFDESFEMRKHLANVIINRTLEPFLESEAPLHRDILVINQITANNVHLTDDTMNVIGQIIQEFYPHGQYNFQSTVLALVEQYIVHDQRKDDMQFLYEGAGTAYEIGHWIFIFFSSLTNKLHVYNSTDVKTLTQRHKNCVKLLYPYINIQNDVIFDKLRNKQKNATACGVYAAAYAISKAIGKNPTEIDFKMSQSNDEALHLRLHLAKIVSERILLPFPESIQ